jgi:hypothetical protein
MKIINTIWIKLYKTIHKKLHLIFNFQKLKRKYLE